MFTQRASRGKYLYPMFVGLRETRERVWEFVFKDEEMREQKIILSIEPNGQNFDHHKGKTYHPVKPWVALFFSVQYVFLLKIEGRGGGGKGKKSRDMSAVMKD